MRGMASLHVGGRWCPECNAEYRPGFVECADCRVPLTDVKADPGAGQEGRDHDQLVYDHPEWSDDRRRGLTLLLTSSAIVHEWKESRLVVPRAKQGEVDDLITFIEGKDENDAQPEVTTDLDERAPDDESIPLAGPGRRLVGYLLDGFVLGLPTALVFLLTGPSRWVTALGLAFGALYEIVSIAIWGRTLGKLAARTRVVVLDTWAVPGWARAAIRWIVAAGPGLAAVPIPSGWSISGLVPILGLVWSAVVFWGLLTHPLRQGLHDRAAETIVVIA